MADLDELFGSDSDDDEFQPQTVRFNCLFEDVIVITFLLPQSRRASGRESFTWSTYAARLLLSQAAAAAETVEEAAEEEAAEEDYPEEPAEEEAEEQEEEPGPLPSQDDDGYRELPPEQPRGPPMTLDAPPITRLGEASAHHWQSLIALCPGMQDKGLLSTLKQSHFAAPSTPDHWPVCHRRRQNISGEAVQHYQHRYAAL